jgi:hypothetical protein
MALRLIGARERLCDGPRPRAAGPSWPSLRMGTASVLLHMHAEARGRRTTTRPRISVTMLVRDRTPTATTRAVRVRRAAPIPLSGARGFGSTRQKPSRGMRGTKQNVRRVLDTPAVLFLSADGWKRPTAAPWPLQPVLECRWPGGQSVRIPRDVGFGPARVGRNLRARAFPNPRGGRFPSSPFFHQNLSRLF